MSHSVIAKQGSAKNSPQEQIKLELKESCVCVCCILAAYTLDEGLGHYLQHKWSGWCVEENVLSIQR